MIYLDSSATSFLKPPQVAEAVFKSFSTIGNAGRGAHAPTLNASRLIYDTRDKLAALFGSPDPSRIVFACNATEALNIAIHGAVHTGEHVITTACEHNSVLRPLYLKEETGTELTIIPTDEKGRIRYDLLNASLKPNTAAIVLTHASNLTGNVTDMAFVSDFAKKHGLLLIDSRKHSDQCHGHGHRHSLLYRTQGSLRSPGNRRPLSPGRLNPAAIQIRRQRRS